MLRRTRTYHPPKALALVLALLLLVSLVRCSDSTEDAPTHAPEIETQVETGPYFDGDAFSMSGGRYRYDDGTTVAEKTGIDVSDHQGPIDWAAVASDGINFAFLRAGYRGNTEGGLFADELFATNLAEARAAGLECGAYFYSQATSAQEAEEEAAFVLELLAGTPLEYPVAFDYEVTPNTRISNVSKQTASEVVTAFCAAIEAGGYMPMVYGNTFDLAKFNSDALSGRAIWCAEYDDGPSYERKPNIWQYTNEGHVNGIDGLVDLNLDLSSVAE